MKKTISLLAIAAAAMTPALANAQTATSTPVVASAGKALYSTDGKRIGAVYRVLPNGSPQLILGGKLVTVPASTLSGDNGKVMTSLTRAQLASSR